jgi:hypothetical protein
MLAIVTAAATEYPDDITTRPTSLQQSYLQAILVNGGDARRVPAAR